MNKNEWKIIIKEESVTSIRTLEDMFISLEFKIVLNKIEHCIGLQRFDNKGRKYHRHGKCFYKAYRNHYDAGDEDIPIWEALKELGYAYKNKMYHMSPKGIEWYKLQTGIIVKFED